MTPTRQPYKRTGRCVHCGRLGIVAGDPCQYSKTGHATLELPHGKTCGDCVHIPRCEAIFGHIPADETCDWYPIKYLERPMQSRCEHVRLNEDGICRSCGEDCRGRS